MAREGLGLADALAAGLADVRVVQEAVDGRGGQGFGHQLVKRSRVQIGRHRYRALLVRGIDQAVQALGGVLRNRQEPDVITDHEVGAQDPGDGLGH